MITLSLMGLWLGFMIGVGLIVGVRVKRNWTINQN
jgi:hypothetical protein